MIDSFLQSSRWASFQKSLGRKAWQVDGINIIKHNLPLGKSYLYVPRCEGKFLSEEFLKKINEIAKKENAIFWKVEPLDYARGNSCELEKLGFKKSDNIQPTQTLILDIRKSQEELLPQMHYKTRYNIGLAEKKGIKIERNKEYFEKFWELLRQTTKRDGFKPHPKEYYRKMLEIPGVELFVAEFPANGASKHKVIAANIVVFFEKTAIYLHGASDYEHRNLMAPHLLQWEQINEAKKRSCIEYDFWGIDEKKWPGVTRFKNSFGGQEISYPGAYDLVFKPVWYKIYKLAKKLL